MAITSTDVPVRTPMFDSKGALSRTWFLFFQSLAVTGTTATVATSTGAITY